MGNRAAPANPASHVEILREATRDANAAVKDLRQMKREVEEASKEAQRALAGMLTASIEEMKNYTEKLIKAKISEEVATFKPAIDSAIKRAEEAVFARFDEIGAILLGEKGADGKRNGVGLTDVAKKYREMVDSLESGSVIWQNPPPKRETLNAVGIDESVARKILGKDAV